MGKVRINKVWRFSRNKFCNTIGCIVLGITSGIGGLSIWWKQEKKSGNKMKRCSVRVRFNLYGFGVYYILFVLFFVIL